MTGWPKSGSYPVTGLRTGHHQLILDIIQPAARVSEKRRQRPQEGEEPVQEGEAPGDLGVLCARHDEVGDDGG